MWNENEFDSFKYTNMSSDKYFSKNKYRRKITGFLRTKFDFVELIDSLGENENFNW